MTLLITYQHDAIASNKWRLTHANGVADDPDGEVGAVLPQPRRGELRVLRPEHSHCSLARVSQKSVEPHETLSQRLSRHMAYYISSLL